MTGQAMGGIFASVANIITLAAGTNVIDSGLGFFIAATLTSVLSLLGYGLLYYLVSTYLSRLVGKPTMWFQNRSTQTGLYKHRRWLETGNFVFRK